MTLAYGTDRLESARLVLRRIAPDDLPYAVPVILPQPSRSAARRGRFASSV